MSCTNEREEISSRRVWYTGIQLFYQSLTVYVSVLQDRFLRTLTSKTLIHIWLQTFRSLVCKDNLEDLTETETVCSALSVVSDFTYHCGFVWFICSCFLIMIFSYYRWISGSLTLWLCPVILRSFLIFPLRGCFFSSPRDFIRHLMLLNKSFSP